MNAERVAAARAARAALARAGEQVAGRLRAALTAEEIAALRRRRDKGMTVPDIAATTGMSRASVYRALQAS